MKNFNFPTRIPTEEFITVNREYYDKMKALAELNESAVKCVFDELLSEEIQKLNESFEIYKIHVSQIKYESDKFYELIRSIYFKSYTDLYKIGHMKDDIARYLSDIQNFKPTF